MPTRKPARKGKGVRGQRGLHLLPGITALLEDDPKKIQQSETEGKNEVSDPVEHKVSITQDILIEIKERRGTDLSRFVFDQTGGGLRFTSRPKSVPPWVNKKKNHRYLR